VYLRLAPDFSISLYAAELDCVLYLHPLMTVWDNADAGALRMAGAVNAASHGRTTGYVSSVRH
jgi:hypothetical protein